MDEQDDVGSDGGFACVHCSHSGEELRSPYLLGRAAAVPHSGWTVPGLGGNRMLG